MLIFRLVICHVLLDFDLVTGFDIARIVLSILKRMRGFLLARRRILRQLHRKDVYISSSEPILLKVGI
jgi:hypothetical protein